MEELLAEAAGPIVQNATRGRFLARHAARHADFLGEWGAIYERFGVPAEIGLAQAIVESGLNGRARSQVRALGFCQWLPRNWNRLKRLSPYVIEGYNQTTQAPFCAAYLIILTTMYDSFIPALSEHHAGGVNVGRTVVNGAQARGAAARGSSTCWGRTSSRALRDISVRPLQCAVPHVRPPLGAVRRDGVRQHVQRAPDLLRDTPQSEIHAMRVPRNTSLSTRGGEQTGLSRREVKRYNPALVRQRAEGRGAVSACLISKSSARTCRSGAGRPAKNTPRRSRTSSAWKPQLDEWHEPAFEETLQQFRERFAATGTEEGTVMATTLAFVIDDLSAAAAAAPSSTNSAPATGCGSCSNAASRRSRSAKRASASAICSGRRAVSHRSGQGRGRARRLLSGRQVDRYAVSDFHAGHAIFKTAHPHF